MTGGGDADRVRIRRPPPGAGPAAGAGGSGAGTPRGTGIGGSLRRRRTPPRHLGRAPGRRRPRRHRRALPKHGPALPRDQQPLLLARWAESARRRMGAGERRRDARWPSAPDPTARGPDARRNRRSPGRSTPGASASRRPPTSAWASKAGKREWPPTPWRPSAACEVEALLRRGFRTSERSLASTRRRGVVRRRPKAFGAALGGLTSSRSPAAAAYGRPNRPKANGRGRAPRPQNWLTINEVRNPQLVRGGRPARSADYSPDCLPCSINSRTR